MLNRVAIVTGASQGVGRALAVGLAREGFKIAAMARSVDKLSTVAAEAGVPTDSVLAIKLDLSSPDSIQDAVRSIPKDFGELADRLNLSRPD